MIREAHGDLLTAEVDAVVNTVNTVGVMGKGIALQFKKRYPDNFKAYAAACKADRVQLGAMFVFDSGSMVNRPRWIINFPTKSHWRSKSRLIDIETGLDDLARLITELGITSIAVPPLGCGHGGLRWSDVEPLITEKLGGLDADVLVFPPDGPPPAAAMARESARPPMSVGKAALVAVISRYSPMALGATPIEVQKLMYFLQEAGHPLKLRYTKGIYGPYADNLRHVLNKVEGHFLQGYGDGSGKVLEAAPIEVLDGAEVEAAAVLRSEPELTAQIDRVLILADGFESAYGMELLATVHWAATHSNCDDRECVVRTVRTWNQRKARMFTEQHIDTALDHLLQQGWVDDSFAQN